MKARVNRERGPRHWLAFRVSLLLTLALAASLLVANAGYASQTCREWWRDHETWKARVVALYLSSASQRELDGAMFEVVQLEAYLTACESTSPAERSRLVSHRTLGRPVDDYGAAVVESLLEESGFDLSLAAFVRPGERDPGPIGGEAAPSPDDLR